MIDKKAFQDLLLTDEQKKAVERAIQELRRNRAYTDNLLLAGDLAAELAACKACKAALTILLSVEVDLPETDASRAFFSLMEESRDNAMQMTERGIERLQRQQS